MSHVMVLQEIESLGLDISVNGGDLRLQGPREKIDAKLVERIKAHKPQLVEHLTRQAADQVEGFGLTPLQRGYLFGRSDIFEGGNVGAYVFHEIEGAWDLDRLETALRAVVTRHSALRSRFTAAGTQIEQEPSSVTVSVERLDLRGQPEPMQAARILQLRHKRSHRRLDPEQAPLVAVQVMILAEDRMVMHVGHDSLVMDGISMFLFFRAWWAAYQGGEQAPQEESSFEAYVAAIDAAATRAPAVRSREYWMGRLDGLAPHPDLPLAVSPSAVTHPRFSQRTVRLDASSWVDLKKRITEFGLTPSSLLLAAYAETLAGWGAGPRFTITTTFANRPPIHPRICDAIGNFSDTMLVEIDTESGADFATRAGAVQQRLRRDLDNRHFSGVDLMRELARTRGMADARMPFTFNCAIDYVHAEVDGSALELFGPEVYTVSQTPQVWLNVFAMEQHGGLVLQIDGVDELFPEGLLDAIAEGYRTLLHALLDRTAWSDTTFDLLPAEQRARRRESNVTETELPQGMVHDAFVRKAAQTPDAPAILTTRLEMSYGELYQRASRIASWLRAHGVRRDELVALVMTRGPEQVIGILATVLAGGAYLPIDGGLPAQRQNYMLADGRVRCVLTNCAMEGVGDEGLEILRVDAMHPPEDTPAPQPPPLPGAHIDDLAYVVYTSGTTGNPKGVMASHRSVVNIVEDCNARFAARATDRFFAISAFNFDLSVYDIFGAFSVGAAIVMPEAESAADPAHWLHLCDTFGITIWNSVPAIASLMHDQVVVEGASLDPLRLVMLSGDYIPPALPAKLRRLRAELDVVSLGGATETTIWSITHPIGPDDSDSEPVPYGRPSANNRAFVLGRGGLDTPDWVVGEICFSGTGLARGYWADEVRTAERFFDDTRRGERLYRTGDLGRYLPDGNIAILGRTDNQIKVNGYRIEAGEIETRMAALDGVQQAIVVKQQSADGDRLVAHLQPTGDHRPGHGELRAALRGHLPDYMIPSAVVWHPTFPLTGNGKVDRGALHSALPADTTAGSGSASTGAAPSTETESAIAQLWATTLKVDDVVVDRTLTDLGGDSITAARILTALRKQFGVAIQIYRMPEVETVRAMAAFVDAANVNGTARVGAP